MDDAKLKALKAQIEASLTEEENDSEKYLSMAENAPPEYAPILHDIAREERIHKKHLRDILDDMTEKMHHHETVPENMK